MSKKDAEITKKWGEHVAAQKPWDALGTHFAFYGTLRREQGNYNRLVKQASGSKFEGQRTLNGYKMFSFGGFPFVIPTENENDTIIVDLFSIPDELAARSIHYMELGAGYGVEELLIDGTVYWLYIYPSERDYVQRGFPEVPGGDWVTYITAEREKQRKKEYQVYKNSEF